MAHKASKPAVKIELTAEQKEQVRQAVGHAVSALELTPEELEERVAPRGRLAVVAPEDFPRLNLGTIGPNS